MEHRLDAHLSQEQDDIPLDIVVEWQAETIRELGNTFIRVNEKVLRLEQTIRELEQAIKELETEHEARDLGRVYEWNNRVRAGGEYYE